MRQPIATSCFAISFTLVCQHPCAAINIIGNSPHCSLRYQIIWCCRMCCTAHCIHVICIAVSPPAPSDHRSQPLARHWTIGCVLLCVPPQMDGSRKMGSNRPPCLNFFAIQRKWVAQYFVAVVYQNRMLQSQCFVVVVRWNWMLIDCQCWHGLDIVC